jgi:hypothetical protein
MSFQCSCYYSEPWEAPCSCLGAKPQPAIDWLDNEVMQVTCQVSSTESSPLRFESPWCTCTWTPSSPTMESDAIQGSIFSFEIHTVYDSRLFPKFASLVGRYHSLKLWKCLKQNTINNMIRFLFFELLNGLPCGPSWQLGRSLLGKSPPRSIDFPGSSVCLAKVPDEPPKAKK